VAAAAALADVVLMIAAVVGAVLRVARNLATTSSVSARVMFGLHGGFSGWTWSGYAPAGLNRVGLREATARGVQRAVT